MIAGILELPNNVLAIFTIVGLVALGHYLYFLILPQRAIKRYTEADPERLRHHLNRIVATPSLLGGSLKLVAHQALVGIYFSRGQHAEAIVHCRACLKSLTGPLNAARHAALEADIRRRLADCLEAIGQVVEAEEERNRAERAVDRAPADPLRHLTQGTLLERQNRHEEAYAAFLKALELSRKPDTDVRINCLIHLVLAAYNTGRPADCLRWSDEAIALGAKGMELRAAHRMAGLACGNLGRLEDAEHHYRQAHDLSAAENNTPAMAENLASLASCLQKRGRLVEAYEACTKAVKLDPKAERKSFAVQAVILRLWGRYDEALAVLARHLDVNPLVIPAMERRVRAANRLDTARIEAECGRSEDAWTHIQEALQVLADDAKLGLKCEAAASWVLAARGLADESRDLSVRLEPRVAAFERDPSICRGVFYDLGMAACTRGDHHDGIRFWTRYLALSPDPAYRPTAHYHRGECYRHLAQLIEARSDYQAAIAANLDTHDTKLAQRRLSELVLS